MLGVIVGMALEARIVEQVAAEQGVRASVVVAIATPGRAGHLGPVEGLAARGASRIVSFGLAGGLAPALRAGDIVCPAEILAPDGARHNADGAWRDRLTRAGASAIQRHAGVTTPVLTVADKVALYAASRAESADMESHIVAHDATRLGLPFLVLRVIVDPGDRDVPRAAAAALGPAGRIAVLRLIGGILRRPGDLPGLLALGRDMRAARNGLARAARLLLQPS
jgi:hypothetical protein